MARLCSGRQDGAWAVPSILPPSGWSPAGAETLPRGRPILRHAKRLRAVTPSDGWRRPAVEEEDRVERYRLASRSAGGGRPRELGRFRGAADPALRAGIAAWGRERRSARLSSLDDGRDPARRGA